MAGILRKLTRAADTNVCAALINDRCRGTHRRKRRIVGTVVQLQSVTCCNGVAAVLRFNLCAVERAALGGKVVCLCYTVIADRAANITVKAAFEVQYLAGQRVEQIEIGALSFAVVCADYDEIIAGIGTGPIEAAILYHTPCCSFFFHFVFRILIRQGNAHKGTVLAFTIPKACISITI